MMKNIIEARKHRAQYFVSWGNFKNHIERGRLCFGGSLCGAIVQDEWYTFRVHAKSHCNDQVREPALHIGLHSPSKSGISSKHMLSSIPLYNHSFALCAFMYSSMCIESVQSAWLRTR